MTDLLDKDEFSQESRATSKTSFMGAARPPEGDAHSSIFLDRYGNQHDSTIKPFPIKERLGVFGVFVAHGRILLNFPPWAELCREMAQEMEWCAELPGGGVKDGETEIDGLIRELEEETGMQVDESALSSPAKTEVFFMNLYAEDADTYYRYTQKFYYYDISDLVQESKIDEIISSADGSTAFWQPLEDLDDLILRYGHSHIIYDAASMVLGHEPREDLGTKTQSSFSKPKR